MIKSLAIMGEMFLGNFSTKAAALSRYSKGLNKNTNRKNKTPDGRPTDL